MVSAETPTSMQLEKDIPYAQVGDLTLTLDLYRSASRQISPLIVWAWRAWRAGNKSSMPLQGLVAEGHAIASVDYRLTTQAKFPANVHDIKAAIRFLRAKGPSLGIDAEQIVIAGASAGGHLAALVGVTNDHAALEGTIGDQLETSSSVQGVISFFGASNLTTILNQSTPYGLSVRIPALKLLLGGAPEEVPDTARLASPFFIPTRQIHPC